MVVSPATDIDKSSGRVAVAMSGGVDSSVAAALLVEQGWDVIGIHMKLHDIPESEKSNKKCCSVDDSLDARRVCSQLGIPFYVVNHIKSFREQVIDNFISDYQHGLTPNPCVMCNDSIKHGLLLSQARQFGCSYLATGHYARLEHISSGWKLSRPYDTHKDQTYFLFTTLRKELPWLLFPLAEISKSTVRDIAHRLKIKTWDKPESQEICFISKDYRSFLKKESLPSMPGALVDMEGSFLGMHPGIAYFTIGQRRHLGINSNGPMFVVDIKPHTQEVVLGAEEALFSKSLSVKRVNWVSCEPPRYPFTVEAKVRYSHKPQPALVIPQPHSRVKVRFHDPVRAITPGQAVVFYDRHHLLGGGWIESPYQTTGHPPLLSNKNTHPRHSQSSMLHSAP